MGKSFVQTKRSKSRASANDYRPNLVILVEGAQRVMCDQFLVILVEGAQRVRCDLAFGHTR